MERITQNSELVTGKYYWLYFKSDTNFENGFVRRVVSNRGFRNGEELREFENGTWCHDSNSQALEKFYIFGPIEECIRCMRKVSEAIEEGRE